MRAQRELLAGHLAAGARQVGWKVGVGSPAGMQRLQIAEPLVGFLLDRTLLPNDAEVDLGQWRAPFAEAEVAAIMGTDPAPNSDGESVWDAVEGIVPAIELADVHPQPEHPEAVLAGNIFHRAFITGSHPQRRMVDDCSATIRVNRREPVHVVDLQALTGRLDRVLMTVANVAAAYGRGLLAGDVVLTGSIIPLEPLVLGTVFSYELEGFAPLTVRVSDA
jgi:2-keto-4-pentenoate hydratase